MAHAPLLASCGFRLVSDAPQNRRDVGGALAQTAHEIRKPFASEWHVDPQPVAGGDEHALQISPDAVEHLEFETVGRDLVVALQKRNGPINGWSVSTNGQTVTATRSDVLASGGSYLALPITVAAPEIGAFPSNRQRTSPVPASKP